MRLLRCARNDNSQIETGVIARSAATKQSHKIKESEIIRLLRCARNDYIKDVTLITDTDTVLI